MSPAAILNEASAIHLRAGDLRAIFLPARGMLGASFMHCGKELLGRVDDLDSAASKGSTAGIPLLHPWANRLSCTRFRAAGLEIDLPTDSPLLHVDGNGLPIHGVPWAMLPWRVIDAASDRIRAQLDWTDPERLRVFPFVHEMEMIAALDSDGLTIETILRSGESNSTPASFGFHPYVTISDVPRERWRVELPAMQRLMLDARGLPTGERRHQSAESFELANRAIDDGFALPGEAARFTIAGGDMTINIDWIAGYRFAQVYAPREKSFIAIEPMTAPTNALVSGKDLQIVPPGGSFRAAFRISVEARSTDRPTAHPGFATRPR